MLFKYSFVSFVGVIFVVLNNSFNSYIFFSFSKSLLCLSSSINPTSYPICLNLWSALSCLNNNLYSARDVSNLYGSLIPLVIKSSINTPIYAWFLFNTIGSLLSIFLAAFIPAISPWHAASSYPLVPLIWPAVNNPLIFLTLMMVLIVMDL